MVREVVKSEGTQQGRVVVDMGNRERDELTVPGSSGTLAGPGQVALRLVGDECGRHEQPG